jgi:hypothetical protein
VITLDETRLDETRLDETGCDPTARLGAQSPILPLILLSLSDFEREGVSYCYWRSSRRVQAALTGGTDLDLLIGRQHQHCAERLLLERGYKLFPSVAGRDHPAVSSFLGYDEPSGLIIHLHLHFRLVVGVKLLKNHRLPWEEAILARAVFHPTLPLRMLDPEDEALLCAMRAALELRRMDPVALRSWRTTEEKFALDRRELAARVDRAKLRDRAAELLNEGAADMIVDTFCGGRALESRRRLRRRLRKDLAAHRSYNALEAQLRSSWRAVLWVAGEFNKRFLHLPRPWSRRAPGGGCVVAVVGVDGSGKTTVVAAIRAWLAAEVDVVPTYFGTGAGRPSLVLLPLKAIAPLIMRLFRTKPKGASHGRISGRAPGLLYGAFLMVWATVLAMEKRLKLLAARRGAERGLVVLADRYPQNELCDFNDGPLLPRLNKAPAWLRRFEARAYALARRLPPDLVIKLEASPEILARREPDMDPAVIRERVNAARRLVFGGARVVRVDAEQPLADVIRAVKREIWHLL